MPTAVDDNKNRYLEVTLEEYRTLWAYYNQTLNERHRLNEYYFKTVTFPATILAIFTIAMEKNNIIDSYNIKFYDLEFVVCILFLVASISGFFIFSCHVMESKIAKGYLQSINEIRCNIALRNPELIGSLKIPREIRTRLEKNIEELKNDPSAIINVSNIVEAPKKSLFQKLSSVALQRIMITTTINVFIMSTSLFMIFSIINNSTEYDSKMFFAIILIAAAPHIWMIKKYEI